MSLTLNGLCLILYLPVTLSFGEFRVQKRRYRVQIPCTLSRPNAQESQHRQQGGFTNRAELWGVSAALSCPLGSSKWSAASLLPATSANLRAPSRPCGQP